MRNSACQLTSESGTLTTRRDACLAWMSDLLALRKEAGGSWVCGTCGGPFGMTSSLSSIRYRMAGPPFAMKFMARRPEGCADNVSGRKEEGMTQAAVAQNWFATLALLAWPFVALWLYQTRPVNQATLWTILGGYLLLPVGASIKLAEGIPQLDKISIPALAALAGCFFFARRPCDFGTDLDWQKSCCSFF